MVVDWFLMWILKFCEFKTTVYLLVNELSSLFISSQGEDSEINATWSVCVCMFIEFSYVADCSYPSNAERLQASIFNGLFLN